MAKLVIVGAGAAGVFAAINAKIKRPSLEVILLEGSRRPLTKVKISGGGRCNVTHSCFDPKKLVQSYPRGFRELLGPFNRFQPKDIVQWYKERDVQLKTEPDGRMFPVSNSSQTIIDCLMNEVSRLGVDFRKGMQVKSIVKKEQKFAIEIARHDPISADYVLLATGSSPIGHTIAKSLGHQIVDPVPSLFTFNIEDQILKDLAGQSFTEVEVKLRVGTRKKPFIQVGPLLITHWGLSGPAVLKLSAFAARELFSAGYEANLTVNFLNRPECDVLDELMKMKSSYSKKQINSTPLEGLTKKFWLRILEVSGVNGSNPWSGVSSKSIRQIVNEVCQKRLCVRGKGQFKDEFVTCGGVRLKDIDFRTMQSKVVGGLYFAGEILDIDGITGGFNFQNAWTTSWTVAQSLD